MCMRVRDESIFSIQQMLKMTLLATIKSRLVLIALHNLPPITHTITSNIDVDIRHNHAIYNYG